MNAPEHTLDYNAWRAAERILKTLDDLWQALPHYPVDLLLENAFFLWYLNEGDYTGSKLVPLFYAKKALTDAFQLHQIPPLPNPSVSVIEGAEHLDTTEPPYWGYNLLSIDDLSSEVITANINSAINLAHHRSITPTKAVKDA